MDCLVLPFGMFTRRRPGYRRLTGRGLDRGFEGRPVVVIAGKEKREFLVEEYVLEEINPFRVLMDMAGNKYDDDDDLRRRDVRDEEKVIFVDVDAMLFEHMLWLMYNDCSSLFELNLREIIDFYSQEN